MSYIRIVSIRAEFHSNFVLLLLTVTRIDSDVNRCRTLFSWFQ